MNSKCQSSTDKHKKKRVLKCFIQCAFENCGEGEKKSLHRLQKSFFNSFHSFLSFFFLIPKSGCWLSNKNGRKKRNDSIFSTRDCFLHFNSFIMCFLLSSFNVELYFFFLLCKPSMNMFSLIGLSGEHV